MFLVLGVAACAESRVMWLGVECFKQRIRAQIRAQLRAEKRLLLHSGLRSACPR